MRRRSFPLLCVVCAVPLLATTACRSEAPPLPMRVATSGADIALVPDTELVRGLVPKQTTLDALLRAQGLQSAVAERVIAAAASIFDLRRLRASQPFVLERTHDGQLRQFEYEIDEDRFLRVAAPEAADDVRASVLPIQKDREEALAAGHISEAAPSLFQAMESTGERADLSIALAEIFAGEIDFNTELQRGDRFGLAFEKFTREERPATYGAIDAAEFHNDGRVLRAVRFTPPGGKPAYYDEHGRSLRRFFLRSPLKFEPRITSGFSMRRFHPVLGQYRAHLGVDYGAPTGAPVVAVASGSVVSSSFDRANGRMVRLRHASGYETYYLHLSAFGAGIHAGAHVNQGQVIGLVGSTGLASGPHLDYRVRKNGVFVNPLREHRNMPPGEPVPATAMAEFEAERDRALARLSEAMATLPSGTDSSALATAGAK
jgi:murein DD-endopeptidase MepM/ murein hydrolase activator NlpD